MYHSHAPDGRVRAAARGRYDRLAHGDERGGGFRHTRPYPDSGCSGAAMYVCLWVKRALGWGWGQAMEGGRSRSRRGDSQGHADSTRLDSIHPRAIVVPGHSNGLIRSDLEIGLLHLPARPAAANNRPCRRLLHPRILHKEAPTDRDIPPRSTHTNTHGTLDRSEPARPLPVPKCCCLSIVRVYWIGKGSSVVGLVGHPRSTSEQQHTPRWGLRCQRQAEACSRVCMSTFGKRLDRN